MLNLYVYQEFSPDWGYGLAFAIASSEEEARKLICEEQGFIECLLEFGPVQVFPVTKPIGFGLGGSA